MVGGSSPGILVLVYPRGWFGDRIDRWIAGIALVSAVVYFFAVVLLLEAPDADTCDCVANAYQIADAPALFAAIDFGYRLASASCSRS